MKRKIVISSQYKKDIKLARRRNLPEEELNEIVLDLANDIPLPAKNQTENFISSTLFGQALIRTYSRNSSQIRPLAAM